MKIYMASSWKNVAMVRELAYYLRRCGHEVDDFTDDSRGRYVFHWSEVSDISEIDAIAFLKDKQAKRAFEEDKKWIDWADAVVLVLPAGRSAHLEAGYAKGQGKLLIIVGEFPKGEFDVMYGFADLLTRDYEEIRSFLNKNEAKKLFKLNEDGVAEWVVAESKQQAFEFMDKMWGGIGKNEYFKEFLEDNPGATFEEFIDYFVTLEDPEKPFTYVHDNGGRETKTVKEWLKGVTEVPSCFACSEY